MITGIEDAEYNRMRWACRRGQLELDLWLLPLQEAWPHLTVQQKDCAFALLSQSDGVLWDLFLQQRTVLDIIYADVSLEI